MNTTAETTDIRMEAWNLGRNHSITEAYALLENGHPVAVRVFKALSRNEWGVKAAWTDGLKGVNVSLGRNPRTGVTTELTGQRLVMPARRTHGVAANGGTI